MANNYWINPTIQYSTTAYYHFYKLTKNSRMLVARQFTRAGLSPGAARNCDMCPGR